MDLLKIKAFAFDIDGVATDGSILCIPGGDLLRVYDAKDSFAVRMAVMNGYPMAVITGGSSMTIRERMVTVGLKAEDVFLRSRNKMDEFKVFLERYNLQPEDVMYFGDDVPLRRMPRRRRGRREGGRRFRIPVPGRKRLPAGYDRKGHAGPGPMGVRPHRLQKEILVRWT